MADDSDLNLKIGADATGLRETLESANRQSDEFTTSFKASSEHLNATLRELNTTLENLSTNTQKTADATQHLSNIADLALVITGVSLLGSVLTSAARGVVAVGAQVRDTAIAFDQWAKSEAYITNETNSLRIENERFGQSYKPLISNALDLAVAYGGVRYASAVGSAALASGAVVARGAAAAYSMATTAAVDLAMGLASRLTPTGILMSIAYAGAAEVILRLGAAYGRASVAVEQYFKGVELYKSGHLEAAAATAAMSGNLTKFTAEVKAMGFENATRGFQHFIQELLQIKDMSGTTATAIEESFASIPNYTGALNEALVKTITLITNSADEAKKLSEQFTAVFKNPEAEGEGFLRSLGDAGTKLLENFHTAQQTGDVYKMQAALMPGLVELMNRAKTAANNQVEEQVKGYTAYGMSRAEAEKLVNRSKGLVDNTRKFNEEMDAAVASMGKLAEKVGAAEMSMEQVRQRALDVARAVDPSTARLEATTKNVNELRAALGQTARTAADFIKQFEGFEPKAKPDVGGKQTLGYGQTTRNGRAIVEGDTTTQAEAYQWLVDRVESDQAKLEARLGESWRTIGERGRQAITSVAYQYGLQSSAVDRVLESAKRGEAELADTIERLPATANGKYVEGIHDRLIATAAYVRGATAGDAEIVRGLNIAESQQKALNEERAGGNVIQKTELEIARAHAKGISDEIDERKKLAQAIQTQYEGERDPAKRVELEKRAAVEQTQIRELEVNRMRAQAQLEAGVFESGSEKRYRVLMAELDKEAALRAQEPDKLREIEIRKQAVKDEFEKTQAREAQMAEDGAYQEKLNRLREEADGYRELASMKRLTDDELRDALMRNLTQREEAERAHWEKIKEIWGEGTRQYDLAQKRISEIASKESLARSAIERQANMKSFNEYNSTFQNIYQSISSSLMGVVTRQQTMTQAIKSILQNMSQMVLGELVKKAAAWSAAQMVELTSTVATEGSKTAAVGTGEAARSELVSAGAATQLATRAGAMLKSILSSAAEAFAGVFGFLAPTMGPAAAGPAAASESAIMAAATSAVGLYDIGAWNLPNDQLAYVHKSELVMPAYEANAFRNMLSNGGKGDAPSVAVHNYAPGVVIKPEVTKDYVHIVVREAIASNNKRQSEAERRSP